jgi:sec-independent protein translocase protein TatB
MFDIGWSELFVIGVVALIVIGPKDLPKALRTVGVWVRKARQISGEFRASVDQMMRESELDEVRQQIKKAADVDLEKELKETVDPKGELADALKAPELPNVTVEPPPFVEPDPPPSIAAPPPPETAPVAAPAAELPAPEQKTGTG